MQRAGHCECLSIRRTHDATNHTRLGRRSRSALNNKMPSHIYTKTISMASQQCASDSQEKHWNHMGNTCNEPWQFIWSHCLQKTNASGCCDKCEWTPSKVKIYGTHKTNRGSLLNQVGVILRSLLNHVGVMLRSRLNHVGAILKSLLYRVGVMLGSRLNHIGVTLNHLGIMLGSIVKSYWRHVEVWLKSTWDHAEITFKSFWYHVAITFI